jgi:murein DD-endopeptidase MepM/ murein hydrolase activator NlpD
MKRNYLSTTTQNTLEEIVAKRAKTVHLSDLDQPFLPSNLLVHVLQYLPSIHFISCTCALVSEHWNTTIHSYIDPASELLWYRVAHRPQFINRFQYTILLNESKTKLDQPFRDVKRWYKCVQDMICNRREHYINSVYHVFVKQFHFPKEFAIEYIEQNLQVHEQQTDDTDDIFDSIPYAYNNHESRIPIGSSKIGGFPDLPKGIEWPRFDPLESLQRVVPGIYDPPSHYDFIAQINLTEMSNDFWSKDCVLPSTGMLYIFNHMDGEHNRQVRIDKSKSILYFSDGDIRDKYGGLERVTLVTANFAKQRERRILFPSLKSLPNELTDSLKQYLSTSQQKQQDFDKAQVLIQPLLSSTFGSSTIENEYTEKKDELDKLYPLRIVNCDNALLSNDRSIVSTVIEEIENWEDIVPSEEKQQSLDPQNWLGELSDQVLSNYDSYTVLFNYRDETQQNIQWSIVMLKDHVQKQEFHKTIICSQSL